MAVNLNLQQELPGCHDLDHGDTGGLDGWVDEALELVKKPEKQLKIPSANAFEQMVGMAQKKGILSIV